MRSYAIELQVKIMDCHCEPSRYAQDKLRVAISIIGLIKNRDCRVAALLAMTAEGEG
jgi:hypothetical protein